MPFETEGMGEESEGNVAYRFRQHPSMKRSAPGPIGAYQNRVASTRGAEP